MTQDEIMKLAVEAWGGGHEIFWFDDNGIERFAALVAAHEREACAKVCDEHGFLAKHPPQLSVQDQLRSKK